MDSGELSAALFREADADRFILTSEESVALNAAWQVLQAFELRQYGQTRFYGDESRDSTLAYLRDGGEERPHSGIFAVELGDSINESGQTDLRVSNRNGRGDEAYRAILRTVVGTVGVLQF